VLLTEFMPLVADLHRKILRREVLSAHIAFVYRHAHSISGITRPRFQAFLGTTNDCSQHQPAMSTSRPAQNNRPFASLLNSATLPDQDRLYGEAKP
jgi:hypothetical protein